MYIDKLNDIVSEYSNTYHRRIKSKPVDVKFNTYIDSMELHSSKEINEKYHKLKLVIMKEFPSTTLLKDSHQICLKKFL